MRRRRRVEGGGRDSLDDGADGESGFWIGGGDGEALRESDVRRRNLRGCGL